MEKTINRQQMQTILDQAPQGVDKGQLIQKFVTGGFVVEGVNDKKEPNLAQTIAGGLIKAPTDLIGAGFAGAGALGSYAGKKLAGQDTTLAQEYANQSQQVQQSGANAIVQPLTGQEMRPAQTAQELTGDVLQTGAIAMPGVGLARGAATGAALLGGQAMSEGQSALDVAKNTLIGGAGGAALGVALPALESLLGSAAKSLPKVAEKVGGTLTPDPAGIMQRVLRTTKGQQANFEQKYGTSIGQYAVDRGLIGTQEKVVNDLANRFTTSIKAADDALALLPGKYQPEPVKTALQQLYQKKLATSAPGAADPELDLVKGLLAKFENGGLDMTDINQAKRLFERNVKLDFVRTNNPEGVTMSNNVDNAIREWQFGQAERLGLKNLPEINKETRMAKDLLNSLEREMGGKSGNNAISLTDWIVLADGGASNIAAFLAKKGFSSDTAQAFVAKYFAPKTKVGLPSAKMEAPQIDATVQSYFDFLKKTGAISQGSKTPSKQPVTQKLLESKSLQNTIPQSTKAASKKVEKSIPKELQPLAEEARKYKSAEEFVKTIKTDFPETKIYRASNPGGEYSSQFGEGVSFWSNNKVANAYKSQFDNPKITETIPLVKKSEILDLNNKTLWKKIIGRDIDNVFELTPKDTENIIKYAKEKGYKIVNTKNTDYNIEVQIPEYIVLDKNILKTKQQLIDIWKSANGS